MSSIVCVNGERFTGDVTQLETGNQVDMIFNTQAERKRKTWHEIVLGEEGDPPLKQPHDLLQNGGGELPSSHWYACLLPKVTCAMYS